MGMTGFIWDFEKEAMNIQKHGIDFSTAALAFFDPHRKIFRDSKHSRKEERFFCIGKVSDRILTVRFVYRGRQIRIYGAGEWRNGRKYYEEEKK